MARVMHPSALADEREDIITARKMAAAKLQPLFVSSKNAAGEETPGVFHTYGIAVIIASSPEYAQFVAELRSNSHARALAIVAAARGNKHFPPALVAEFLTRPDLDETNDWFADVFLGGLVEIFQATCSPGRQDDGIGLLLPPNQEKLDLARGAYNVCVHVPDEIRKKLGLFEADEAPRRQLAVSLMAIAEERPALLTPVQLLYRWAMRKYDERHERREVKGKDRPASSKDAASGLPQATPPPAPESAPPVVPGSTALAIDGKPTLPPPPASVSEPTPPPAPRASRKKEKGAKTTSSAEVPPAPLEVPSLVVPPAAAPAPASTPPASPAEVPASTAPTVDEGQELVLSAIKAVANDESKDKARSLQAKALLATFARGEKPFGYVVDYATRLNLL